MTFAFAPHPTRTLPGQGRGGGLIPSPKLRLGSLPAIMEGVAEPEIEEANHQSPETKEVEVGRGLMHLLVGTVPPEPTVPEKQQTMFTYRAQLTWGLDIGPSVDLPTLFRAWVTNTSKHIPNFSLVPFEDELGQVISTPEQVPTDNVTFYQEYYHNHRVLCHGNLTGMVQFCCSVSWNKIKRMKDPYFQWLQQAKVYLNLTKFKSDTLVLCGFLLGAHPGHLHREDAEKEMKCRLEISDDFPFQLSSRTISDPIDSSKISQKYSFPAVAVETSVRQAKSL